MMAGLPGEEEEQASTKEAGKVSAGYKPFFSAYKELM